MLDGEVVLPVVGERLVERAVLLGGDLGGVAGPALGMRVSIGLRGQRENGRVQGLGLVELDLLGDGLLDGLGLLLLVLVNLLDLGLAILVLPSPLASARAPQTCERKETHLLLLLVLLLNLLVDLLDGDELDGVGDELGVLLDNLLENVNSPG